MKTKDITARLEKLSAWGSRSPEDKRKYYGNGVYFTSFQTSYIYNLTEIDRLEIELDREIDRDLYDIPSQKRKEIFNQIDNKLEPLRQNVMKATQALDNYLRIAGQQAKEIIESTAQKELENK